MIVQETFKAVHIGIFIQQCMLSSQV